ncbi:hypothetical protein GCM10009546_11800 [Actinomadura livida]|uniref:Uncharacterized protein n=1 Tax=Actinomadura livida TaxID=79909 RepID=A0ABP3NS17_9ACTN|nr:hypothetical protein GCM10010208_23290 [Actinomadura livida]
MLLHGKVPHEPGMRAMHQQPRLLGGGRAQPVPGHARTIPTATDKTRRVTAPHRPPRFLPALKDGVSTL